MGAPRIYTKDAMERAVAGSTCWADLIRWFGKKPCGGNYSAMQKRVKEFGIDISHFTGQGWSKGKKAATDVRVERAARRARLTDEQILVRNAPSWIKGSRLKRILLKNGRRDVCERCGQGPTHCHEPLTLQVDHKNGDNTDNRIENLRILCPNCHTQQLTSKRNREVQRARKFVESSSSEVMTHTSGDELVFKDKETGESGSWRINDALSLPGICDRVKQTDEFSLFSGTKPDPETES